MSNNEEKALKYLYLSSKKALKDPKIKGLSRKSCFEFVKTVKEMSCNLSKYKDLEEVLNYED